MFSRRAVLHARAMVAAIVVAFVASQSAAAAEVRKQVPVPPAWLASAASTSKAYQDVVKRRKLQNKEKALAQLFPSTAVGRALLRVAVLIPYGLRPYNSVEFTIVGRSLSYLNANASAALAAIDASLKVAPQRYYAEQQFLIQFASRLPLPRRDVLAFLGGPLRKPARIGPKGAPDASFYTSAVALSSILRLTKDTTAIESMLVPAIRAKSDIREKQALLAQYHLAFPSRAERLSTRLGVIKP